MCVVVYVCVCCYTLALTVNLSSEFFSEGNLQAGITRILLKVPFPRWDEPLWSVRCPFDPEMDWDIDSVSHTWDTQDWWAVLDTSCHRHQDGLLFCFPCILSWWYNNHKHYLWSLTSCLKTFQSFHGVEIRWICICFTCKSH